MAQYQVPQFIETEDKIVGPLTLKQFLYIAIAALISFLLFFVLKLFFWFLIAGLLMVIAVVLAFGKYNGRPLPMILISALKYFIQPRLYLWQTTGEELTAPEISLAKTQAESPLKSLFLKLTTVFKTARPQADQSEAYRQIIAAQQMKRRVNYR